MATDGWKARTIAASIAAALGGSKAGRGFICLCPSHADRSPSLSIRDGDDGRLLVHCFSGCDPLDILAAIRTQIGDLGEPVEAASKPTKGSNERRQHDKARWLWSQRRPIKGTIAERYLREVRRIASPLPPTLAFLPARKPDHHSALISAFGLCAEPEPGILAPPDDVSAVHLTLLKPDGSGKAEVEKPKLVIASPGGKPIVIAPPNDLLGLAICEGLEDALSVYEATGLGTWAAGSAGTMPALAVPDCCDGLTIVADANEAGQSKSTKLLEGLAARGIQPRSCHRRRRHEVSRRERYASRAWDRGAASGARQGSAQRWREQRG